MLNLPYNHNCVGVSRDDLDNLHYMIDNAKMITRHTFVHNVNKEDRKNLEAELGYGRSFPMSKDWHVQYFKSKTLTGKPVYFLSWSAIEYFFYN